MADTKITALAAITTVDPAADVLPIVDISDTSMAASGTTKKITSNQILGSGGTATLASAAITGDLTVDTSTLKVDSTNNRVGIGTASPSYDLQVNGATNGRIQVEGASGFGMVFIQGSSGNTAQLQLNSSGGSGKRYALSSNPSGSFSVSDETASASRLTIDTSGNVNISTGNVVMTTSGKGIDFSATAGTGTSELLNDYEEGTWTGSLLGVTTNPTVPVTATGSYTKIGRIVRIAIQFSNVSTVGASGQLTVSGIPFTNSSIAAIGNAFIGNSIVTITGPVFSAVSSGASSNVDLVCQLTSGDTTTANHSAGTGKYLTINTVYTV
jgi:hypothetical protein